MSTNKVTFGEGTIYESMPGWKPLSSEKSKLKGAFTQLQKDLKTVPFEDESLRKGALSNVKSAEKGVSNPGWGGVLGDLDNAMEYEIEGRGLNRREDTAIWETYLVVMEVLVGLTERLARSDGRWFVRDNLRERLNDMRQKGLKQGDLGESYFNMEYPWTKRFSGAQMGRLNKAARGGFTEGVGIASDALMKMAKKAK